MEFWRKGNSDKVKMPWCENKGKAMSEQGYGKSGISEREIGKRREGKMGKS